MANPRRTAAIEADRPVLVAAATRGAGEAALVSSVRAVATVDVDATGKRDTVDGGARNNDKVDLAADRDLCMAVDVQYVQRDPLLDSRFRLWSRTEHEI